MMQIIFAQGRRDVSWQRRPQTAVDVTWPLARFDIPRQPLHDLILIGKDFFVGGVQGAIDTTYRIFKRVQNVVC